MVTTAATTEPRETARERALRMKAERDYALLTSVGLTTGETWFPPGTEAVYGKGKAQRARRDFLKCQPGREALAALADTVVAEDRQDVRARWCGSMWDGDGTLPFVDSSSLLPGISMNGAGLAPTDRAIQQLCAARPEGSPAPAWDFAAWAPHAKQREVVLRSRRMPAERVVAYGEEYRELYAVVSPEYKPYDLDAAAHDLAEIVPEDSRARVRYDGARARVDIILQNPYVLDGDTVAGVGETHRVVLRMRTADDGSGGYHLSLLAERVRCVNLSLLHAKRSVFHGTHRREDLRELAKLALAEVEPAMAAFAETWRAGWHEFYADAYTRGALAGDEALRRIVAHGKFRIPGLGKEGTEAAVLSAWNEEPGDSRIHVHNALTRAAHTSPTSWATRWCDDEAEEQASALLYQHVSVLAPSEVMA